MWRLYIPLQPLFIRRESHQNMPTLPTYIFWERTTYTCVEVKIFHCNHMNLDLYPSPSCFPLKSSFHHIQICERELSVGETIIWSTRARSSSSTHHLLPFGEWCLLDRLGVTWEPLSRLWSWTKEFVRASRSPISWRSTLVRQVIHGRWPWWDRQGCFFVDTSWVEPFVGSRSRYPSWVEISINVDVR